MSKILGAIGELFFVCITLRGVGTLPGGVYDKGLQLRMRASGSWTKFALCCYYCMLTLLIESLAGGVLVRSVSCMGFPGPHALASRRAALGFAAGMLGGSALCQNTRAAPFHKHSVTVLAQAPSTMEQRARQQGAPPTSGPNAVNLRDIGDVAPGLLRKGVVYRCSQIYTPQLLEDLKIKTVVDLRGRTEKKKKKSSKSASPGPSANLFEDVSNPMPLMSEEAREAFKSGGDTSAPLTGDDKAAAAAAGMDPSASDAEFSVIRTPRASTSTGGSVTESEDEEDSVQRRVKTKEELAQSAMEDALAQVENFNLIPNKEFGLTMLKMPP